LEISWRFQWEFARNLQLGSAPQQSNHSIALHKFLTDAIQERNSSVQPRRRNLRIKVPVIDFAMTASVVFPWFCKALLGLKINLGWMTN
jgi:hypothetical protein